MRIAFDGHLFLDNRKTGIAQTGYNLLTSLAAGGGDGNEYAVNVLGGSEAVRQSAVLKDLAERGVHIRTARFGSRPYRLVSAFLPMSYSLFFGRDVDATVFFNYVIPPGVCGRKLVFIHDMTYRACPETMDFRTRKLLEKTMAATVRRADLIITISDFSKCEIVKYLGVPEDTVSVLPCGVDHGAFNGDVPKLTVDTVLQKYGVEDPYILYLGTIEPRKNLTRLVRAYGDLRENLEDMPTLVLAGRDGWGYGEVHKLVSELGLDDHVRFLGFVDDGDRPALLRGALFFAFPSVYEGFGIPLLEAMACGTPAITSNAASLPEVAGGAALLVDPLDEGEIKGGLYRLCMDGELRRELSRRGTERAKRFSWDAAADGLREILLHCAVRG